MNAGRVAVLMAALAAMLCSCVKYDMDEILLEREELSLTWKGEDQIVFDPLTWQVASNVGNCEYRVNDDNMANYFVVRCSERPVSEGQDVTADVEWTLTTNTKRYEGLRFTVRKVRSDGLVWMWNKSQKIGVVIQELEQN